VPLYLVPPRLAASSSIAAQAGLSLLRCDDLMNTNLRDILSPGKEHWYTGLRLCSDDIPRTPGRRAWLTVVVLPGTGKSGQRREGRGPGCGRTSRTRGFRRILAELQAHWEPAVSIGTTDVGDFAASRNERDFVRRRVSLIHTRFYQRATVTCLLSALEAHGLMKRSHRHACSPLMADTR
jgi:hypothetical protein